MCKELVCVKTCCVEFASTRKIQCFEINDHTAVQLSSGIIFNVRLCAAVCKRQKLLLLFNKIWWNIMEFMLDACAFVRQSVLTLTKQQWQQSCADMCPNFILHQAAPKLDEDPQPPLCCTHTCVPPCDVCEGMPCFFPLPSSSPFASISSVHQLNCTAKFSPTDG